MNNNSYLLLFTNTTFVEYHIIYTSIKRESAVAALIMIHNCGADYREEWSKEDCSGASEISRFEI